MNVFLYLEDGSGFCAQSFGSEVTAPIVSEIVFNTSMQGYQEVITDPSYCDQAIVMTYPLIGNYGISADDSESVIPHLKALIVKEYSETPSNFRSRQSLQQYLQANNVVGIHSLDTRLLTKKIRTHGTMKSVISSVELSKTELDLTFKQDLPTNQVAKVSTKAIYHFPSNGSKRVVIVDFGYKKNILESLIKRNCDVIVVPYDTSFEKIVSLNPKGILLSNGPGDPKSLLKIIPTIQKLQSEYPMLAICMGHQIFALANNADTEKMKFGHRGGNHPVQDLKNKRVYITAQNHGYCVNKKSITKTDLEVTQVNLNDKTIEGLKHKFLPSFSIQYHPEASPGPNDTKYLFDSFIKMLGDK